LQPNEAICSVSAPGGFPRQPGPGRSGECDDEGMTDTAGVTDNEAASRFQYEEEGHLAELTYRLRGDRLVLIHAGTPAQLRRRGIGGALMAAAVDRAQREGLTVVPLCPFARHWLERHPDATSRVNVDLGQPR
jgi:predicted GNAT family acetyltransferase